MLSFSSFGRLLALSALALLGSIIRVQAQKNKAVDPAPVVKFGVVAREQFNSMPVDSTAEAVVLYNYGEVTFYEDHGDIYINFIHHVRTKINKRSAYNRATIEVPVRLNPSGGYEYVSEFDGYSYNLTDDNVASTQFNKTGHFTEKVSDTYSLEKYTLPNVREGSIIEYRYTLRTPFTVNYNPRTWYFQQNVPVNWSEYRITIPDYFYYKILQTGYLGMTVNERQSIRYTLYGNQPDATASVYQFAIKNIPAFHDEPYITTDDDYMSKIEFELASYQFRDLRKRDLSITWDNLERTLLERADFGGQIKRASFLRETAQTLLKEHPDTLGRVTAAYDFIRNAVKWNKIAGVVSSEDIKKIYDNKKGDAADINLMLVALLREMNLDANPVILSTRSHGRVNELYPLLRKFNYVIAQVSVGGRDMLLDATDLYLPPGMLPLHCLSTTGRLIKANASRFVSLLPDERDTDAYSGNFTISDDGEISGTLRQSHGGYSAWNVRKEFASEGKTKFLDKIQKRRPIWQLEKADITGTDWRSSAFNAEYTLTIPEACGRAGNRLYLRPMLTEGYGQNPFKEEHRLYPVDFGYAQEKIYTVTYTLPQGYEVEEMPKPVSMVLPQNGGRFSYQLNVVNGNQLQVVSRILLRKPAYSADEYPNIRELFSRVIAKQAEPVVLKRGTVAEKK